jgi:predicted porin
MSDRIGTSCILTCSNLTATYRKPDFSGWVVALPVQLGHKLGSGRRGWALTYTDRMVSYESGKAFDSGVATQQRASAPTYGQSTFAAGWL